MDIVKQCEIEDLGSKLTYFEGMKKASNRYGISQLNSDYKNMRNDIVHEGKISGTNFSNKTKEECSEVVANTLNWIDEYISKVCKIDAHIIGFDRWAARDLYQGLPSISLYL